MTIIPDGRKVLPPGTVSGILEIGGIPKQVFEDIK